MQAREEHARAAIPPRLAARTLLLPSTRDIPIQSRGALLQALRGRSALPGRHPRRRAVRALRLDVHQLEHIALLSMYLRSRNRPQRGENLCAQSNTRAVLQ